MNGEPCPILHPKCPTELPEVPEVHEEHDFSVEDRRFFQEIVVLGF